jgi:hypothetical protein
MKYISIVVIVFIIVLGIIGGRNIWLEFSWKSRVEIDARWIARYLDDNTKSITDLMDEVRHDQNYSFNHKDWTLNKDGPYWVTGPTNYGKTLYIKWDKMIMWDG